MPPATATAPAKPARKSAAVTKAVAKPAAKPKKPAKGTDQLTIGSGRWKYAWHDQFTKLPLSPLALVGGRTQGIAVLNNGDVVVCAQSSDGIMKYGPTGRLKKKWGDQRFIGAHGLTKVDEGGKEFLWLVDCESAECVKFDTNGKIVETPKKPKSPGKYLPTWSAVGPDGKLWITDGLGSSLIHAFDGKKWCLQLTGEEGAGRFSEPHAIAFSPAGELWIADSQNKRIAVYDADGKYLRHSDDVARMPQSIAFHKKHAYVADLHTGIRVIDQKSLEKVADLGANDGIHETDGWPNLQRTTRVAPGKFNSPHDVAVDADGNVYVAEWIIGGRTTKLEKL